MTVDATTAPPADTAAATADDPALRAAAAALLPGLQDLRRRLHAEPETGLVLPATQAAVLAALEGLGLEITTGTRTTSVVAVLRGGSPGPTVLLRGDMDALPLAEQTGLDYQATNGSMHACGHDLHTAGLVGAARLLAARRDELVGDVLLMFQPGEESWGGAEIMIEEGLLEASGSLPVAAYALHVGPGERGVFQSRPGPVMASSNSFYATYRGDGGHGSTPWKVTDPVPAIAELTLALSTMVARRTSVFDPAVLSVTMLNGSATRNVIPETAGLGATVRAHSEGALEILERESVRLAEGIGDAHGLATTAEFSRHYPPTVNDAAEIARVEDAVAALFGAERYGTMPHPMMGSEDFSFVLQRVPGAFVMVGASPDGVDPASCASNHSPYVLFDDAVLADMATLLAHLALTRLR
ncbi:M20 metallopeptidase family protein [Clavibacter phaseoli]|uniref:M20 metallopeptidase family protein n=2 Tax=Clavibacter phaseoli TaxID=1734031 RepID=UPI001F2054AD|nr:M20 family metallopeptidase [Clavibacter phaseoli]UKF30957.1 amidohydrolase [Clavibacter phaseoli]UKF36875.1 amidohydrolase [Clavibacter phaseoli]